MGSDDDIPEGVISRKKLLEFTQERDFVKECFADEMITKKRKQEELEVERQKKEKKDRKKEKKKLKKLKKEEKRRKKKEKEKEKEKERERRKASPTLYKCFLLNKVKKSGSSSSSSDSDSDDSSTNRSDASDIEGEWVPAETKASKANEDFASASHYDTKEDSEQVEKPVLKREDWMTIPMVSTRRAREPENAPEEKVEEPLKNEKHKDDAKAEEAKSTPVSNRQSIGDGGMGWKLRALQRAKELASEQGRKLEDVLMDRYGNLNLLAIEGKSMSTPSPRTTPQQKLTPKESLSSSKLQMRSPSLSTALRWTKDQSDNTPISSEKSTPVLASRSTVNMSEPSADSPFEKGQPPSHLHNLPHIGITSTLPDENESLAAMPELNFPFPEISDPNILEGKALKAQMKGDQAMYEAIKKQMEYIQSKPLPALKKVVVLPQVDQDGKLLAKEIHGDKQHRTQKRANMYDKDGNRTAFFNDDHVSLEKLMEREKKEGFIDQDAVMAQNITRNSRYKEKGFDEDYELDQDMSVFDEHRKKQSTEKQQKRQEKKLLKEYNIEQSIQENCWFCFDSPKRQKHLAIAYGEKVYLSIPDRGILHPYQCQIVPMAHIHSSIAADEEVFEEIEIFKKSLSKMMSSIGLGIIFIETNTNHKKKRHMFIECIPLPMELAHDAPLYYRKAIMESDEEWSQNKKLIDTSKKGLRRSIPKDFPYFHVEFGSRSGGFAHVIEDEERFPHYYGKSIVGGMLDCQPNQWLKPRKENPDYLLGIRKEFLQKWQPFDWTVELDGGDYEPETGPQPGAHAH